MATKEEAKALQKYCEKDQLQEDQRYIIHLANGETIHANKLEYAEVIWTAYFENELVRVIPISQIANVEITGGPSITVI